jgi:hypothetical protein
MNKCSLSLVGLIGLLCAAPIGCGDDGESEEPSRFPQLSEADDLQYAPERLGVGFHHGETVQLEPESADGGILGQTRPVISHAFLNVNLYDQFATTLGEYHVYSSSDANARGASFFDNNRNAAKLGPRADDLHEEVSKAMGRGSFEDFASYSFVINFWKSVPTWYVPWDGQFDRPHDTYGFYRDDLRDETLDQIESLAKTHTPRYIIVGTDMERLLGTEQGEPLSDAEYSNFVAFFSRAVRVVEGVSPQTKVGAGINWERFTRHVAPRYAAGAGEEAGVISNETLDTAFEAAILPLVEAGGIVALKSYVLPQDAQPHTYQFLRRLGDLYGTDAPVVWYSVGSPASSTANYNRQRTYLESFAEWNAGVNPEMVAWRSLLNIDGADVSTGDVTGRCRGLTGESNGFDLPEERCFDGLFSSVLQPKPAFRFLQDAAVQ